MPQVHHVDVISGVITGYVDPADPDYTNPVCPTTEILASVDREDMVDEGNSWFSFQYKYTATAGESRYFRLRGTNLPQNTANETDAEGNPLLDFLVTDLDTVDEAFADLWFYSNPINVMVEGDDDDHTPKKKKAAKKK
jgi:hypothetical protein